jgi:hypothetical protein
LNEISEEDMKDDESEPKEENSVCRTEAWRCLSNVVETGIHCFGKEEELMK